MVEAGYQKIYYTIENWLLSTDVDFLPTYFYIQILFKSMNDNFHNFFRKSVITIFVGIIIYFKRDCSYL